MNKQHHANLLIGPTDWAFTRLPAEYRTQTQDVRHYEYEKLTIKDARMFIAEANLKAVEGDARVFVISAKNMLREAQNALLKLFEDPNPNTFFYLILPTADLLLPTLASRLSILEVHTGVKSNEIFTTFLSASYRGRLSFIDAKSKEQDHTWFEEIVRGLEKHAAEAKERQVIEDALMLLRFAKMQGHSKKMLAEHIALTL